MPIEIERKFLVEGDEWRDLCVAKLAIRDGLLAKDGGRKVRVRLIGGDRATISIKGPHNGSARMEFEYDIPVDEARELLNNHCQGRVLDKTRCIVPYGGFTWEIDVYGGELSGIIIAEIELPAADTEFARPIWLGVEVTADDRYRKSNLMQMRVGGGAPRR